jgi:hypothetical protein
MATISNTPRPGYAWDATDNCWYPIGVGGHSHNEIAKSIVTTKGDLIVGTGSGTVVRQGVGADGSVLIADSSQADGVNWAGTMQFAGKNRMINSDMSIWQRGTTFTGIATGIFTADRWITGHDGSGTVTVSRQAFTPGSAPVAGYESQYFLRHQVASSSTSTFFQISQQIEDVRTFAGRTVTVSFWAKADAARSMSFYLEQTFGAGGSGLVMPVFQAFNITTSWARYSVTFDMPSISGKTISTGSNFLYCAFRQGGTTVGNQLDLWGVQIEAGSALTPFVPAGGGSPQAELALCQRYYWRSSNTQSFARHGTGAFASSTLAYVPIVFPVTMRVAPTSVDFSTLYVYDYATDITVTNVIQTSNCQSSTMATLTITVASGGTQYRPVQLENGNNSSGYIGFSAEL